MVYLTCGLEFKGHKGQGQRSHGSRAKVNVKGQGQHVKKKHVFQGPSIVYLTCDIEAKVVWVKVKGHVG